MKLTIIRLPLFSDQDRIDLGKIWPSQDPDAIPLDDHRIYAARFNERLLGAVRVTLRGVEGELSALCVREVTRRRGVGQYLVEEVLQEIQKSALADRRCRRGRPRRDGGVYAGAGL
jgi:ribosomal protein S18 acetylase RimI-like enzyme